MGDGMQGGLHVEEVAFKPAHLGYSHSGGQGKACGVRKLPFTGGSHFSDDCFNETRTSVKKKKSSILVWSARGFVEGNGGSGEKGAIYTTRQIRDIR